MNFKYYDILSNLILGNILLVALLPMFNLSLELDSSIACLAIAYVIGYMVNAIGSWIEGFYYWTIGGKPSNIFLTPQNKRGKGCGHSRIKFHHTDEVAYMLKEELKDKNASSDKMFTTAKQYSISDNLTRVPEFNAQYAFSRSFLTTMIILTLILLFQFGSELRTWFVFVPLFISWYRYKDSAYYYAREVLTTYLYKNKNKSNDSKNEDLI